MRTGMAVHQPTGTCMVVLSWRVVNQGAPDLSDNLSVSTCSLGALPCFYGTVFLFLGLWTFLLLFLRQDFSISSDCPGIYFVDQTGLEL